MKLYIIRHADPDYSIDSLTQKGWREAEALSNRLLSIPIDDFYCSPLGRARATMKPTLEKLGKQAEILPWLREFEGCIEDKSSGKRRICWDIPPSEWCNDAAYYSIEDWHKPAWIARSNAQLHYETVKQGMDELLNRYGWIRDGMAYHGGEEKSVALFCHFGLGAILLAYLLGLSPVVAQNNFFLPPSSVTTLVTETDDKGFSHFRAIGVGDISHLYEIKEPMSESGLYPDFNK